LFREKAIWRRAAGKLETTFGEEPPFHVQLAFVVKNLVTFQTPSPPRRHRPLVKGANAAGAAYSAR